MVSNRQATHYIKLCKNSVQCKGKHAAYLKHQLSRDAFLQADIVH